MLVQVDFLKRYSDTDSAWFKEVYDVPHEWAALDNVYARHTRFKILKFKTKRLRNGSDSKASSTNDTEQAQGTIFGDSIEA